MAGRMVQRVQVLKSSNESPSLFNFDTPFHQPFSHLRSDTAASDEWEGYGFRVEQTLNRRSSFDPEHHLVHGQLVLGGEIGSGYRPQT